MLCLNCQAEMRRFGKNRNGSQRYRCDECAKTYTDESTRPADNRRLSLDKTVLCLRMILEGNSIRSTERLTGVHRDTILAAIVEAGEQCQRFMIRATHNFPATDVQADEIWGFVGCKEKTAIRKGYGEEVGDAWCFVAIERTSRLILTWHVGKRTAYDAVLFTDKLRHATAGRFQLSTDGFKPYRTAVPDSFGDTIDFAQLVKVYSDTPAEEGRYSPGQVVDTYSVVIAGDPDQDQICTSHAERSNLSIRMAIRRMTRLTNAHSKKWSNHEAAFALWFAYYNFCRVHTTLTDETRTEDQPRRKTTPAMAAGLTDHVWSVAELLAAVA